MIIILIDFVTSLFTSFFLDHIAKFPTQPDNQGHSDIYNFGRDPDLYRDLNHRWFVSTRITIKIRITIIHSLNVSSGNLISSPPFNADS